MKKKRPRKDHIETKYLQTNTLSVGSLEVNKEPYIQGIPHPCKLINSDKLESVDTATNYDQPQLLKNTVYENEIS